MFIFLKFIFEIISMAKMFMKIWCNKMRKKLCVHFSMLAGPFKQTWVGRAASSSLSLNIAECCWI
jgi:hypothetical protein